MGTAPKQRSRNRVQPFCVISRCDGSSREVSCRFEGEARLARDSNFDLGAVGGGVGGISSERWESNRCSAVARARIDVPRSRTKMGCP